VSFAEHAVWHGLDFSLAAVGTTKNWGGGAGPEEHFVPWWHATTFIHHTNKRLSTGRA